MRNLSLALFIVSLLLIGIGNSTVLINSYDGRDVVSGTYYAAVIGDDAYFIPNEGTIEMIVSKLKGEKDEIIIIEGKKSVMPNLKSLLESKGYKIKEIIKSNDPYETNLFLGERVKDKVKGYIIVSPSIGYNSVSPIALARIEKYYLLFAEESSKGEISRLTEGKKNIVYGYVEKKIKDEIKGEVEVIDEEDKYLDNIEMVKKTLSVSKTKQVILSDGNFLEYTIMNTQFPVLFISTITPKSVREFLRDYVEKDKIRVALVVGSEYINTAYDLKRSVNREIGEEKLSVFVKLGESYPSISPNLLPYSIFVLPAPYADLKVVNAEYNKNTKSVEILIRNNGNSKAYFTYGVKVFGGNETIASFGSEEVMELNPEDKHAIEEKIEIDKDFEGNISIEVNLIYGVSKSVLDQGYVYRDNLATIEFKDESVLIIEEAKYFPDKKLLNVKIRNAGDNKVFYKITILYNEGEEEVEIKDNVRSIEKGKSEVVRYEGVELGEDILVKVEYGAKEYRLKKKEEREVVIVRDESWIFLAIAVVIVALAIGIYWKSRKERKESKS